MRDTQKRLQVLEYFNNRCAFCWSPAETVDHIEPVSMGGSQYSWNNLVAACKRCNKGKGSLSLLAFLFVQKGGRIRTEKPSQNKKASRASANKKARRNLERLSRNPQDLPDLHLSRSRCLPLFRAMTCERWAPILAVIMKNSALVKQKRKEKYEAHLQEATNRGFRNWQQFRIHEGRARKERRIQESKNILLIVKPKKKT